MKNQTFKLQLDESQILALIGLLPEDSVNTGDPVEDLRTNTTFKELKRLLNDAYIKQGR